MNQRFRYQRTRAGVRSEPWFRLGTFDVGTTVLFLMFFALGALIWAFSRSTVLKLVFFPSDVRRGQIWRLVTWPFVFSGEGGRGLGVIFILFGAYFFYMAGRQIEELIGRYRMAALLAALTIVPAVLSLFFTFDAEGDLTIVSMGLIAAFGLEFPGARFLFGFPARTTAAVIIGLQAFLFLGDRRTMSVWMLLIAVLTAMLMMRALGLGSDLPSWVPKIPLPGLGGKSGGRGKVAKPRGSSAPSKARRASNLSVVREPSPGVGTESTPQRRDPTPSEVDAVLDKISAQGMDSLTPDERAILEAHSRRRRG
jgi:hypothetical protein